MTQHIEEEEDWTGEPCPKCNGSGYEPGEDRSCKHCAGTGERYGVKAGATTPAQDATTPSTGPKGANL